MSPRQSNFPRRVSHFVTPVMRLFSLPTAKPTKPISVQPCLVQQSSFHSQNEQSQWGSIIFVEYDRLQQQKRINQPNFLFHFQKVSVGGHVVEEFALCFCWIVEKRPCFIVDDHHCSPVSSCFSSGNVDELLLLLMNRRAMPLE